MLPLEDGKSLIYEREDIDAHGLARLLHLYGLVEFLNSLGEVLLIEEEFSVVVVHVGYVFEVLDGSSERSHSRGNGSHLVLGHTKLDVRVDEAAVEFDRLLVVLGGVREFSKDEVELSAMVIDVGVILVVGNG